MPQYAVSKDNSRHVTDEKINTISHLAAACFAVLGTGLLIVRSLSTSDMLTVISIGIYGLTLISLFVFSTLHHGLDGSPKTNNVLRTFDYVAVFLLIAGTVTPIVVSNYRQPAGWVLLTTVWLIAATGIALRSSIRTLPKHITNTLYIVMGWLPIVLFAIGNNLPGAAIMFLAIGGILYTIGFVIYTLEKPNVIPGIFGFHELWHILVVLAACMHFIAIFILVA